MVKLEETVNALRLGGGQASALTEEMLVIKKIYIYTCICIYRCMYIFMYIYICIDRGNAGN
jgi:hypothetical protein